MVFICMLLKEMLLHCTVAETKELLSFEDSDKITLQITGKDAGPVSPIGLSLRTRP